MKTTTILVTPAQAQLWLNNSNSINRPIRPAHVSKIAQWLRNGQFKCTSEGISFDKDGVLLNGQHRLSAIVETGIAAHIRVTTGEDRENFAALDTGAAARTLSDSTGLSRVVTDACGALAAFHISRRSLTPADIKPYVDAFGDIALELHSHAAHRTPKLTASPVRAGIVLRVANSPTAKAFAFDMYGKMSVRDYAGMSPSLAALVRQIDAGAIQDNTPLPGGAGRPNRRLLAPEVMLRTWRVSDPAFPSNLKKIQIMDLKVAMKEMRDAISRLV